MPRARTPRRPAAGRTRPRVALGLCLMAAAAALTGCGAGPEVQARIGHYTAPPPVLDRIHRATFVPLENATDHADVAAGTTEALFQAIQARQVFHIDLAAQLPEGCDARPIAGNRAFTLKELDALRQVARGDAVLVGTVSHYHPYPRMQMGLYLRMVDLRDGRLLWAVDHMWDTTDKETQRRLEQFFSEHMGTGTDPLAWQLATVSPRAFQKFVAYEVAQTLAGVHAGP